MNGRGALFLDTSGWLAALSAREAKHREARSLYREAVTSGARVVTTNLVVAEMHILVLRYRGTAVALAFLDSLHEDPTHEVVYSDYEVERAATDRWLRRFQDQGLSLTDAVSFEVMRREKIRRALAVDRHFKIAGYEVL